MVIWPILVYGNGPCKTKSSQCRRFCHVGELVRIPPTWVVDVLRDDIEVEGLVQLVGVLSCGQPLLELGLVPQCRRKCFQGVTALVRNPIAVVLVAVAAFVVLDVKAVAVLAALFEVAQSEGSVLEN